MENLVPRSMITFSSNETRFTFRVAGIVVYNEHVLFEYADTSEPFWCLPGGRAELGETAEETLLREMREELGAEVHIERLLHVVENLFTHEELANHEIGFHFLMSLPEQSDLYHQGSHFGWDAGEEHMQLGWLPISQLPDLPIYPEFLRTSLSALPTHTVHVVNRGGK